jgi:hypothetical protein
VLRTGYANPLQFFFASLKCSQSFLLQPVHESQPQADASLLELFYRSVAEALATADAIEATVKETKRDWDLL